jgi:hypothetical protein
MVVQLFTLVLNGTYEQGCRIWGELGALLPGNFRGKIALPGNLSGKLDLTGKPIA